MPSWCSLEEAQAWARTQGVRSVVDWKARCKTGDWRPTHIPSNPDRVYGDAFVAAGGWGSFFGTHRPSAHHRHYRSLEQATAWVQAQGITTAEQWRRQASTPGWLPQDLPTNPDKAYGDAFKEAGGWGAFLGTGRVALQHRTFRSLTAATHWARAQGLRSRADWNTHCKQPGWRPDDIPANPAAVYGQAFLDQGGWSHFLTKPTVTPSRRRARP